jgi:hypothetical protein
MLPFSLAPSGRRSTSPTRRRIAWVFGTQLVALAALLMLAFPVAAEHTVPLGDSGTDQSGECTEDYFKIESASVLVEGTHTYTGTTKNGAAFTVTLEVVFDAEDEVDSITIVSSNPPVTKVVVKGGGGSDAFIVYEPPEEDMTADQGAISNVAFCLATAAGTPTPTPTPAGGTPTPTPTPAGGEGVAGGTPRQLPNTASAPTPVSGLAIVASIVLVASLGGIAFRRLADHRTSRGE